MASAVLRPGDIEAGMVGDTESWRSLYLDHCLRDRLSSSVVRKDVVNRDNKSQILREEQLPERSLLLL